MQIAGIKSFKWQSSSKKLNTSRIKLILVSQFAKGQNFANRGGIQQQF